MIGLIIFCILLLGCIGVSVWYALTRQRYYDEMMQSVSNSLSWSAESLSHISMTLIDRMEEGEQS